MNLFPPPIRRRMPKVLLGSAAIALLCQSGAMAVAQQPECPKSIAEKSIRVAETPPGWTPFVGSPLYLHGAAPMNGPPEQLGELSDYKERHGKNTWTTTYQLDGKFPEGKWLACTYGESDQIALSQRLDDKIQTCTFTYRKGQHVGQNDITIRCK